MKRRRLIWHIFPSFAAVVVATVVLTVWCATRTTRDVLREQTRTQLHHAAILAGAQVADFLGHEDPAPMQEWAKVMARRTTLRVTVILPRGTVVADSDEDPAAMENHADRPEIIEAYRTGVGERTRYSATLRREMMYLAVPVLREGRAIAVCRLSTPVASLQSLWSAVTRRTVTAGLISILFGGLLSFWLGRRIATPMHDMQLVAERFAGGDFAARLRIPRSRELAGLAASFNGMAGQLADRIQAVTRQKEEAEAIFAGMVEGVLVVDREQRIVHLNEAAAGILGVGRAQGVGRSIQEVLRNPALFDVVRRTLDAEGPTEGDVVLHEGDQETYLQVHGSRLPSPTGDGEPGAVLVLNDVTRLRRLERLRREFAANVSHELRTPITTITGFVETLLDGAIDEREDAVRFLRIVHRHAERLNSLIGDLLTLAGIEKEAEVGGIHLERMPLAPELAAAVAARQDAAAAKHISVETQCPTDLEAELNRGLFTQALLNLIDNAIAYSEPHTSIRIAARRLDGEICVDVVDQGRGIAPEHVDRLFERFYRIDKARSRDAGGTGLGLAIVKHVVQAHHGRIEVASTPGKGSTFTILLPAI